MPSRDQRSSSSTSPSPARDNSPSLRWPFWLTLCYCSFVVALVGGAVWLSVRADGNGVAALGFLTPAIDALVARRSPLAAYTVPPEYIFPACGVLLLIWAAFAVVPWLRNDAAWKSTAKVPAGWVVIAEAVVLALCTTAIVAYRFFALNHLPRSFVGEMTVQAAIATDLGSSLAVAGGTAIRAPWAPIGILHFFWMYLIWGMAGASILAMRLASVLASVGMCQLLYWFGRKMGGPLAAILVMLFYATTPVATAWGRHSMFPFDFPSLLVIAVAAMTYLAIERRHARYWLATALAMGLSFHTFGSAYSSFLIPIGALVWLAVFHPAKFRACFPGALLLLLGVALWAAGPSISVILGGGEWSWASPLDNRVNDRAFRGAGWGNAAFDAIRTNLEFLYTGLFAGLVSDTHQTPIARLVDPILWLEPQVTIACTLGLLWLVAQRRRAHAAVLLALVAGAAAPGLVSWTNAHRETALFPALCIIAGLATAAALRRVRARFPALGRTLIVLLPAIVFTLVFLRIGSRYFARELGVPFPARTAEVILREARPDTLLLLELPEAMRIDVAYLIFDESLEGDFAWRPLDAKDWPQIADHPAPDFSDLHYRLTRLRHQVDALAKRSWRHVVFIIYQDFQPDEKIAVLRSRYPALEVRELKTLYQGQVVKLFVAAYENPTGGRQREGATIDAADSAG